MKFDFDEKYGKLFEKHENAKLETFSFENQHGKMANVFLKREIPSKVGDTIVYDIITPYGFGGPMIIEATDKDKLVKDYLDAFSLYCNKENIVSEFVRFHPLENIDVRKRFDGEVDYVGPQVIRDLSNELNENISKRILKQYRSNVRKGMQVIFDQTGEQLESFLEIYYSTMKRNNADDYYFFEPDFFQNLHDEMDGHFLYTYILIDDVIISCGLILFGETYASGFLGGTRDGQYDMCPNTNITIEEIKWLKEKGISYYLLGGGHEDEDGLYQFKKKFANDSTYEYYVGKKIHDNAMYKELVKERFQKHSPHLDSSFFPAYRLEIH